MFSLMSLITLTFYMHFVCFACRRVPQVKSTSGVDIVVTLDRVYGADRAVITISVIVRIFLVLLLKVQIVRFFWNDLQKTDLNLSKDLVLSSFFQRPPLGLLDKGPTHFRITAVKGRG